MIVALVANERPPDDFRGAAARVADFVATTPDAPVFVATGAIEGQDEAWVRDPERREYLLSPLLVYPTGGNPVVVPRKLEGQPLAREIVDPLLAGTQRAAAIEWRGNGADILEWLVPHAVAAGFQEAPVLLRIVGASREAAGHAEDGDGLSGPPFGGGEPSAHLLQLQVGPLQELFGV